MKINNIFGDVIQQTNSLRVNICKELLKRALPHIGIVWEENGRYCKIYWNRISL